MTSLLYFKCIVFEYFDSIKNFILLTNVLHERDMTAIASNGRRTCKCNWHRAGRQCQYTYNCLSGKYCPCHLIYSANGNLIGAKCLYCTCHIKIYYSYNGTKKILRQCQKCETLKTELNKWQLSIGIYMHEFVNRNRQYF